jgi:hypothetical protein
MNEALKNIDITTELSKTDFLTLFVGQLPLEKAEIQKLVDVYFPVYHKFISSGVDPEGSWVAIRNLFVSQETQIAERIKNGNSRGIPSGQ